MLEILFLLYCSSGLSYGIMTKQIANNVSDLDVFLLFEKPTHVSGFLYLFYYLVLFFYHFV